MKLLAAIVAAGLAISLSSCVLSGKPKVAKNTPAPPKPAPAPTPPPLPQPLSNPQTTVQLPPQQPVSVEALATIQQQEPAAATPPPVRTAPRRTAAQAAPRPVEAAPAPAPPVVATPTEERQPIQEVLPPGERARLLEESQSRRRDAQRVLDQFPIQRMNSMQRSIAERVQSFIKQAEEAEGRGDMRQASELAGRALVLAKELQP